MSSDLDATPSDQEATSIPDVTSRIVRNKDLYQLGVLLIELWYGHTMQALHKTDDGPISTGVPATDLMTAWNTADRLIEELYAEAGSKYADAVGRCIRCDFDQCQRSDLTDPELLRAVHDGVYLPLKESYDFMYTEE
jgi:hypothetical protein